MQDKCSLYCFSTKGNVEGPTLIFDIKQTITYCFTSTLTWFRLVYSSPKADAL